MERSLTLIRSILYHLVHFFLELFLNTDDLSKKKSVQFKKGIICVFFPVQASTYWEF